MIVLYAIDIVFECVEDEWEKEPSKRSRAKALAAVLQANEFDYANSLYDDEEEWKKQWIHKKMAKWALLYPIRRQQTQDRKNKMELEHEGECNTQNSRQVVNKTKSTTTPSKAKAKLKGKPNQRGNER